MYNLLKNSRDQESIQIINSPLKRKWSDTKGIILLSFFLVHIVHCAFSVFGLSYTAGNHFHILSFLLLLLSRSLCRLLRMGVNCFISHLPSLPAVEEGQRSGGGVAGVSEIMRDKTVMDLATHLFGLTGKRQLQASVLYGNMESSPKTLKLAQFHL